MSGATPGTARRRLVVEADGGSRGNPGVAGFGALVRDGATGRILIELAEPLGTASNNVAEYSGLIAGLTAVVELWPDSDVIARMDSKLVVEQMSGRWKIKHPDMQELALRARDLCTQISAAGGSVTLQWIPRDKNKDADALSNEAMDGHSVRRVHPAATSPERSSGPVVHDLRLMLVQEPDSAASVERVSAAALTLLGPGVRVQTSPSFLAAQTGSVIAAALGVDSEVVEGWAAEPASKGGTAGTSPADEASSAAYHLLRREGGTVAVVTTRRGVLTVLADVLGLGDDRFWAIATAPGSLSAVEVWADGTASVAFTNRTAHLA